ncbi:MAG TPA: nitroreductase/quinone reductase family protein [Candidatus Nitrosotenuis sp.]|nr:nitroreductase/quinone reductase family protein [Candidatus Nitrosotenuis sp.]
MEDQAFKAMLMTKGRKSGKEHTVWLRAVKFKDKIYFSRRNPNADWLKNAVANPKVKVGYDDKIQLGTATLVEDDGLARKISEIKYAGEERAQESRIVLQVTLD